MRYGTFEPIIESKIVSSPLILRSRFIDELKKLRDRLKKKIRLVEHIFADEDAAFIATKYPIVKRFSQRVSLSIYSSIPSLKSCNRDITKLYIQSHSELEREVHIRVPLEMGLTPGYLLNAVKPSYGMPESGLHWYWTYLTHHLDTLNMICDSADPSELIKRSDNRLKGLILLYEDI